MDLEMAVTLEKCKCLIYDKQFLLGTLICQGGPMSAEEAAEFENLSNFSAILEMRRWDEAAKDENIAATGNQKYIKIIENIL